MQPMTPSFADKPELPGDLVLLRPVTGGDASGLIEMLDDPEVRRLTGTREPLGPEALRLAEQWYASRAMEQNRLDLAIVERATGDYAGEVVLSELDAENRSCSFRIALAAPAQGRGYGTEATRLILAHAFETAGLNRIELEVFAFNPRARHVYEKVGFVHEGTKRKALWWQGTWVDAHIMAVLADDWSAHGGRGTRS